jgi:hypothetical protein
MPSIRLTVAKRKEVFETLVAIQDQGEMSVGDSIQHVAELFAITEHQVHQIEEEGIDKQWPPLDSSVETSAASESET